MRREGRVARRERIAGGIAELRVAGRGAPLSGAPGGAGGTDWKVLRRAKKRSRPKVTSREWDVVAVGVRGGVRGGGMVATVCEFAGGVRVCVVAVSFVTVVTVAPKVPREVAEPLSPSKVGSVFAAAVALFAAVAAVLAVLVALVVLGRGRCAAPVLAKGRRKEGEMAA